MALDDLVNQTSPQNVGGLEKKVDATSDWTLKNIVWDTLKFAPIGSISES